MSEGDPMPEICAPQATEDEYSATVWVENVGSVTALSGNGYITLATRRQPCQWCHQHYL
jgi:hypothetical protein